MASRRPRPRRLLLPTILAAVLVAEITGIALARSLAPTVPTEAPSRVAVGGAASLAGDRAIDSSRSLGVAISQQVRLRPSVIVATPPAVAPTSPVHATSASIAPRPKAATVSVRPKASTRAPSSASYHGANLVWIPSLGITKAVQSFPCSRSRPPDAGVYRWGCAGTNNVYLLGHAWSTFKPLHDAYVGGRLRTGMKVVYADSGGRVHTYIVIWWKVVAPTTAASWAWAAQSRPSMTLQTCVGSNSQNRLMVRLIQVS